MCFDYIVLFDTFKISSRCSQPQNKYRQTIDKRLNIRHILYNVKQPESNVRMKIKRTIGNSPVKMGVNRIVTCRFEPAARFVASVSIRVKTGPAQAKPENHASNQAFETNPV
jgi:hypothetical protein